MREQTEEQQQQDLGKTAKAASPSATPNQPQEPGLKGDSTMTTQTEDAATGSAARDASRELDALVAEKVMGWARPTREFQPWDCLPSLPGCVLRSAYDLPRYSTDIAAAWLVVEKLRADGWCLSLHEEGQQSNQWVADFVDAEDDLNYTGEELAPTAPLAICRAALLVVGAA